MFIRTFPYGAKRYGLSHKMCHSRIITVTRKGLKISSAPELGVSINEEYRLMVNMKNSLPPCASVALPGKEQTHALSLK